MKEYKQIRQITHNRFLNYYEIEAVDRTGREYPYYVASRAETVSQMRIFQPDKKPDGVAVFSLYGPAHEYVVLIRQYRYPAGRYVYEFPAGLVEETEDFHEAAVREMREETGLTFHPLQVDPMYERAFYTTVGMTDECCSMVYGYCTGEVNLSHLEQSERIEVVLADVQEIKRILQEEQVALICAYQLMHFLKNRKDPFAFLKEDSRTVIESYSSEDTYALGEKMGKSAASGDVIALYGELGTGKTVFTQGFASGLGITGPVSSPTFTILQVYEEGRIPMYHFDVYRIADPQEMDEIGYEDCFYGDGVSLVEWADLIEEYLPGTYTSVTIEKDLQKGFDYRRITIRQEGKRI